MDQTDCQVNQIDSGCQVNQTDCQVNQIDGQVNQIFKLSGEPD